MSELIKVSGCDDPRRVGDVVFVHGPDGDARSTWRPAGHRGPAWPEWLGGDLPDSGVWLLDYEGRSPGGQGHGMPLADRATHALALLETEGLGERPLVFIGHSLGGLLVKQLLRHGREYGDPSWRRIADQTRGIVFLSTPHSGSDITSWVEHLGSATMGTASMRELQANDPRLRELNVWFRNQFQSLGLRVQVYCEKIPYGGRVVVDDAQRRPGPGGRGADPARRGSSDDLQDPVPGIDALQEGGPVQPRLPLRRPRFALEGQEAGHGGRDGRPGASRRGDPRSPASQRPVPGPAPARFLRTPPGGEP